MRELVISAPDDLFSMYFKAFEAVIMWCIDLWRLNSHQSICMSLACPKICLLFFSVYLSIPIPALVMINMMLGFPCYQSKMLLNFVPRFEARFNEPGPGQLSVLQGS